MRPTQEQKAAAFAALHRGETFIIPDPWDAGSARVLEGLGFKALATTSSGFAFTLGRRDGSVSLDELVEHVATLDRMTSLPLMLAAAAAMRDAGDFSMLAGPARIRPWLADGG